MGNIIATLRSQGLTVRIAGKPLPDDPEKAEQRITAEWRAIEGKKKQQRRRTAASVRFVFDKTMERALDNFDRNTRDAGQAVQRAEEPTSISISQILSVMEAREIAGSVLKEDIMRVIREGFRRGAFNAGFSEFEFNTNQPLVRQIIRDILAKTKGIGETTVHQLGQEIEDAISQGTKNSEIRNLIRKYFKESAEHRIATIAQTVTNTSYESGQLIAFNEAGIKRKKWVSVRDGRVRQTHWDADGTVKALNETFEVGAATLMHPSDPDSNVPAEIINCRCTIFPVATADDPVVDE